MTIEIVDFPMNSMVIFHSELLTFTRGYHFANWKPVRLFASMDESDDLPLKTGKIVHM